MSTQTQRRAPWFAPFVLLVAGGGVALAYAVSSRLGSPEDIRFPVVTGSCLLSSIVILLRSRHHGAWRSAPSLGLGMAAIAALSATLLVTDATGSDPPGLGPYEGGFLAAGVLFLIAVGIEFREHVPREDRREIVADVALLTAAIGTMLFLSLRPESAADPVSAASSAEFALIIASGVSAYGALALARPNVAHLGMFLAVCGMCLGVYGFAELWLSASFEVGRPDVDLPIAFAALFVAVLVSVIPRRVTERRKDPARYGRAVLTTVSVAATSAALALVAVDRRSLAIDDRDATLLIGFLAAAVALRILVNQVRGTQSQRAVHDALDQKEAALRETDLALLRLQRANETLRESEERLRTVFESAVDGIVELDPRDVVVRANGAFRKMVELPQSLVEGQPWSALAASIQADEHFASLPVTGQGTIHREGHAIYLESRTSEIPGEPPRRLLLVRDVTAARVADQTIRSLFKFLQDRDEDRTRIMRRTNAAIEGERNRIARDLHDGPVQGVSAASLSLEAVLLMLKAGEIDEGLGILSKVRSELSEEADNLRRLMSGLRPPLLEERGLIPALRETVDRFGRDYHVHTEFSGRASGEIPQDLETLAYRVVQEALSNSSKHAHPVSVTVAVETTGGQLRVEIVDDGEGFDAGKAREYLQSGRVGLASMRERVELANGTFMVHSAPGRGTTVVASLPMGAVPAAREFSGDDAPGPANDPAPDSNGGSPRQPDPGSGGRSGAAGGDVVGNGEGGGLGETLGLGGGLGDGDGDGVGGGEGLGLGEGDGDGLGLGEGDGATDGGGGGGGVGAPSE
ncbi:MAG TPA: ATP-binding protein [Actinomycetota bacterium]|nr:ATP-binding protein [Actinomycetota bacterium]